jgi:hypothetical protein
MRGVTVEGPGPSPTYTLRPAPAAGVPRDLFVGPLGDRGRAVVELPRLAERHAGTREAAQAPAAIARLRAELFADAD